MRRLFFDLKPAGMLIVDSTLVSQLPTTRAVAIPFTQIAREKLGKEIGANIIALGALATLSGAVSLSSLEAAVMGRIERGTEDFYRKALELGIEAARNAMKVKAELEYYEDSSD